MRRLILGLSLLVPIASHAADWIVTGNASNTTFALDVESIRQKPGYLQFWSMISYDPKDPGPGGARIAVLLNRGNCDEQTMGMAYYTSYLDFERTRVIDSNSFSYVAMQPVIPDSTGDTILKLACSLSAGEQWALDFVRRSHKQIDASPTTHSQLPADAQCNSAACQATQAAEDAQAAADAAANEQDQAAAHVAQAAADAAAEAADRAQARQRKSDAAAIEDAERAAGIK